MVPYRQAVCCLFLLACHRPAEPPILGTLSDFRLLDQTGAPFAAADLRGHVWVANFVFTRCTDVCPRFTEKLAAFAERTNDLGDALRLVSFSVDPGYDTPAVLAAYARTHRADSPRWVFVTGPTEEVRRAVTGSLKTAMDPVPGAKDPGTAILHGRHFVLVDGAGRLRGFYDSDDPGAVDRLAADARALARKK